MDLEGFHGSQPCGPLSFLCLPAPWRGLKLGRPDVAATKASCAEGEGGRPSVLWGPPQSQPARSESFPSQASVSAVSSTLLPCRCALLLCVSHSPSSREDPERPGGKEGFEQKRAACQAKALSVWELSEASSQTTPFP